MVSISPIDLASSFSEIQDIREIKSGGQKVVFSAYSEQYGDVVLKIVTNNASDARVLREIEIVKENSFAHVPKMFDVDTKKINNNIILCIIEQKIDGVDLREILNSEYKFPFYEVLEFINIILSLIVEMEKKSIVHRDIKPENIIKDSTGSFWLIDFGIARDLNQNSLTATEANFGPHSAGYAAPEQFRNMKKRIDSRADLFSLGVVAYEMINRKNPFIDGSYGIIDVLLKTERLSEPQLNIPEDKYGELTSFIRTLMQKAHTWRPPSAEFAYSWFLEIKNKLELGGE